MSKGYTCCCLTKYPILGVGEWLTAADWLLSPAQRLGDFSFVLSGRMKIDLYPALQIILTEYGNRMVNQSRVALTGSLVSRPMAMESSGSRDEIIWVWDSQNCVLYISLSERDSGLLNPICYSSDGTKIVSGSPDETIRVWDSSNGNLLCSSASQKAFINFVAYSHNGLLIISGDEGWTIRVWDATSLNLVHKLTNSLCSDVIMFLSDDDAWIVSSHDNGFTYVWNTLTGSLFY